MTLNRRGLTHCTVHNLYVGMFSTSYLHCTLSTSSRAVCPRRTFFGAFPPPRHPCLSIPAVQLTSTHTYRCMQQVLLHRPLSVPVLLKRRPVSAWLTAGHAGCYSLFPSHISGIVPYSWLAISLAPFCSQAFTSSSSPRRQGRPCALLEQL